uniref:Uncharacterized protein n=1 Tax=Glossina brevipalpis TaxID=37001 RepID=A0A1A9X145_9MUSC
MLFKYLILLTLATAFVQAAPAKEQQQEEEFEIVPIVRSEVNKNEDGSYHLSYETGDGTSRDEKATLVDVGTEDEALEVKGSYKYINDKGEEVEVFYTAGVNGFVPYGETINAEISAVAEAAKDLPRDEPENNRKH